ncbi:hypothetical protein DOK78_002137 [Enterococcus sp. DIV2402]|uniref:Uncharacterized protein n=1 Tax=Candidatus Enterococcus lowellii TaxID=2230877 RepID=A0ABZ2STQ6_9ENTE|nr:hypothetical protein [Enterococcus sp. DIV2402]MBO0463737.1 hypothetical protein [Enterococcus sp. DIV2402]
MELQWINEQLDQLFSESRDYKQKAFLLGLKELIIEQQKRKEQLQSRLDGELWSPKGWQE